MPSHPGHPGNALSNAAPTIAEAVDNVFTRFDADANAAITAVEMLKVLDPNGTHTGLDTLINNIVAKLDTNADGSLSKAEVTVALTAMDTDGNGLLDRSDHAMVQADEGVPGLLDLIMGHGGPDRGQGHGPGLHGTPPAAPTIAQVVDGVFTHFDKDASTTISLAELLAVLDPKGTHTERDADLSALFKQIDTNTDSSLSVAEVTAAVTALDTDHSGTLTPADLVPGQMPDATVDLIGILLHGGDGPGHGF